MFRCMASSLVRTGFVRGSMTQGNGCYQHRCVNNSLEVRFGAFLCVLLTSFHKVLKSSVWMNELWLTLQPWSGLLTF